MNDAAPLILISLLGSIPLSLDLTKAASTTKALDAFDLSTGGLEGIVRILRRDAGRQAMHLPPGGG